MAYMVDLEVFHGPLDLLLYLVDKNEVDIYDIPIAVITEQYIGYLRHSGAINLDRLGDFLLMASYLLSLKSRLLLPASIEDPEEEEEPMDPRQELVEKLLQYKRYKEAAGWLQERQNGSGERIYYREEGQEGEIQEHLVVDFKSLIRAYKAVLRKTRELTHDYEIPRGDVNVGDKIEEIRARLEKRPGGLIFQDLFLGVISRREALALFLALLELIRLQQVEAVQKKIFGDIEIKLIK
jgi:segregation and condensation protein A